MVSELLGVIGAWPLFFSALLVFGFAPGAALRIIVLLYPKFDPRRRELVAELYVVPRVMRPVWVAEQLEVALFEGVRARLRIRSHLRSYRAKLTSWELFKWVLVPNVPPIALLLGGARTIVGLLADPSDTMTVAAAYLLVSLAIFLFLLDSHIAVRAAVDEERYPALTWRRRKPHAPQKSAAAFRSER